MAYEIFIRNITNNNTFSVHLPDENLASKLKKNAEYIIIDAGALNCMIDQYDNIEVINNNLKELTEMSPSMLIAIGMVSSVSLGNIDENIRINEFVITDISNLDWNMSSEQMAACYLATEMKIPWIENIDLESETMEALIDYIDWDQVWTSYTTMGYNLYGFYNLSGDKESNVYIIYESH